MKQSINHESDLETIAVSLPNGWFPIDAGPQYHAAYQRDLPDGHLTVLISRDPCPEPTWHMSISHRSSNIVGANGKPLPGRIPTWDEIKEARYLFLPDEVNMAMMLPPKRLYINLHPTTMHLWEVPVELAV